MNKVAGKEDVTKSLLRWFMCFRSVNAAITKGRVCASWKHATVAEKKRLLISLAGIALWNNPQPVVIVLLRWFEGDEASIMGWTLKLFSWSFWFARSSIWSSDEWTWLLRLFVVLGRGKYILPQWCSRQFPFVISNVCRPDSFRMCVDQAAVEHDAVAGSRLCRCWILALCLFNPQAKSALA